MEEAIPSEVDIRYNNEKILNNKIQYAIRSVQFVKLPLMKYSLMSYFAIYLGWREPIAPTSEFFITTGNNFCHCQNYN